jgi:hypothetical protein
MKSARWALVAVVVVVLDGGFLDGAVHAFDLAVGPGMLHLGEAMLDAVLLATRVEHVRDVAGRRSIGVALWKGELDAIVRQHDVDLVGDGCDQGLEEGGGRSSAGLPHDLHKGKFADTIDRDVGIQLAFGRLHFGDVDVGSSGLDTGVQAFIVFCTLIAAVVDDVYLSATTLEGYDHRAKSNRKKVAITPSPRTGHRLRRRPLPKGPLVKGLAS